MNRFKKLNSKGQTLVESIIMIPTLCITIFIIFWFLRVFLTQQQILMAARYGTDMIFYTDMKEEEIKKEIIDYLCSKDSKNRILDEEKLKIDIKINRLAELDGLEKIISFMSNEFLKPWDYTSSVDISYKFSLPRILKKELDELSLKAHSEVLVGTGAKLD
jgi:hypothetical protein